MIPTPQQINNRMVEKEISKGAAMAQLKNRPQPDWDVVAETQEGCAWMDNCKPQINEAKL